MSDPIDDAIRQSLSESMQQRLDQTFTGSQAAVTSNNDLTWSMLPVPPQEPLPSTFRMSHATWSAMQWMFRPTETSAAQPVALTGSSIIFEETLPLGRVEAGRWEQDGFKVHRVFDVRPSPRV